MSLRDIGLFLRSARTDARLSRLRDAGGDQIAFETLYREAPDNDPWASADSRFRYQRQKYASIAAMVPKRRYGRGVDLGCGTGLLTRLLAPLCDELLGIDISEAAVQRASALSSGFALQSRR